MTDRYHALTVVLEDNLRSDDAKPIIDAIRMVKGVVAVRPDVADAQTFAARSLAKHELLEKIWKVLREED